MKKVLITLGSVMILAFTGCGGASGVQNGLTTASQASTTNSASDTVAADRDSATGSAESGVANSALIDAQIASQAEFLGQPINGVN